MAAKYLDDVTAPPPPPSNSKTHNVYQTRTQSLFMSLGKRERRLDSIEASGVTWHPARLNRTFPPDSLIATG